MIFQKHSLQRVPLEAHAALERKFARSTLLLVVLSGMSAFDLYIYYSV